MSEQKQVDEAAKKDAALHFNKEFSPDQWWACVCCFKAGANWQSKQDGLLRWVKASERLPEVGEVVDTWNGNTNRRARLVGDQRQWERYVDPIDTKGQAYERRYVAYYPDVTHWMPLPLPPKEQKDERSVANVDAGSGEAGQQKATVLKEGVAEVERIAGSSN